MTSLDGITVAVLGGTGPQGRGLVRRWATAGIADRDRQPRRRVAPREIAAELAEATGGDVRGLGNADAAAAADVVIVSVPYDGHADLLRSLAETLAGKIVVDCVNPIGFDKQGGFALEVPDGSAAQEAAALLPDSIVVRRSTTSARSCSTTRRSSSVDTDILVLGRGSTATRPIWSGLWPTPIPGMRGVYAGRLRNAHQVEALTANLIAINRRYKAHAGLRVTDL